MWWIAPAFADDAVEPASIEAPLRIGDRPYWLGRTWGVDDADGRALTATRFAERVGDTERLDRLRRGRTRLLVAGGAVLAGTTALEIAGVAILAHRVWDAADAPVDHPLDRRLTLGVTIGSWTMRAALAGVAVAAYEQGYVHRHYTREEAEAWIAATEGQPDAREPTLQAE